MRLSLQTSKKNSKFLNSEQDYILDEIKFIQKLMADSESIYASWERWFLLAFSVLASAAMLILKEGHHLIPAILSIFGLKLSYMFQDIQNGNCQYARSRAAIWKESEKRLKELFFQKKNEYMQILAAQDKFLKTLRTPLKGENLKSTWEIRKSFPIIFINFWSLILVWTLTNLFIKLLEMEHLLSFIKSLFAYN